MHPFLAQAVLQGRTTLRIQAVRCQVAITPFGQHQWHRSTRPFGSPGFLANRTVMSDHIGDVHLVTSEFLSADDCLKTGTQLHLILLNYVLPPQTAALWQRATTKICADGGANRLFDQISGMVPGVDPAVARSSHLPDLIKGDLDSVRLDVQDFYTCKGVPFVDLSSDQETTDLEKCLLFLEGRLKALSDGAAAARSQTAAGSASAAALKGLARTAKGIHAANAFKAAQLHQGSSSSSGSFCSLAAANPPMQDDCSTTGSSLGPQTPNLTMPAMCQSINDQQHQQVSQMQNVQWSTQQQQECSRLVQLQKLQRQLGGQQPAVQGEILMLQQAGPGLHRHLHAGPQQTDKSSWLLQQQQVSILDSSDGYHQSQAHKHHTILVLGALGGRLDHTLANLNTLYCYRHLDIVLWGEGNLVRLVRAGSSLIQPSSVEGPSCGLVPLAQPATASSTGLKWDLHNTHMCFRGLLSTSNIICSDQIHVTTDEDLLWITAVGDGLEPPAAQRQP